MYFHAVALNCKNAPLVVHTSMGHTLCSLFFKREMELALIGLNYAGKSTLVEVLASGHFNQDLFTTVRAFMMTNELHTAQVARCVVHVEPLSMQAMLQNAVHLCVMPACAACWFALHCAQQTIAQDPPRKTAMSFHMP